MIIIIKEIKLNKEREKLEYLNELNCKRCGYTWTPRSYYKPKSCPHCKNRKWDEEREER